MSVQFHSLIKHVPDFLSSIQSLNDQIYQEIAHSYLQRTQNKTYKVKTSKTAEDLVDWLSQLDGGFDHIRFLCLYNFDPASPATAYTELLLRCTKLETLTLNGRFSSEIVSSESAHRYEDDRQTGVAPLQIWNTELYYHLKRLRRLEWRDYQDTDIFLGENNAAQLKLLVGSSVKVCYVEVSESWTERTEEIPEKFAIHVCKDLSKWKWT